MSFSSSNKVPQPHATIGCQELLATDDVSHSGSLMKPLKLHRRTSFIGPLIDKLPWKSRYVILSKGSVYLYTDSIAKKPSSSFSLYGYHQVVRAGDVAVKKYPWTFKIVNLANPDSCKYFAAGSEREMKIWMREIRSQVIVANADLLSIAKINAPLIVDDDELEKSIYKDGAENIASFNSILHQDTSRMSTDSGIPEDSDDDSDDYDKINDTEMEWPLPPTPPSTYSDPSPPGADRVRTNSVRTTSGMPGRPTKPGQPIQPRPPPPLPTKPKVSPQMPEPSPKVPLPSKVGRSPSQESKPFKLSEVYWDGDDKLAADQLIREIGKEGVFLIRSSDNPACVKTLVCFAEGRPVKFMIKQNSNGMYYIMEERTFPSILQLLYFYHRNNLPKKMTPLTMPHSKYARN